MWLSLDTVSVTYLKWHFEKHDMAKCRFRHRNPATSRFRVMNSSEVWWVSFLSERTERATGYEFHAKAFNVSRQLLLSPGVVCVKVYSDDEISVLILFNSDPGNTGLTQQFRGVAALDFASFLFR
jgi:hypothetical protein